MWEAQPSAVALPPSLSTLEAYDDLLNYGGTTYQYLNNSTGLINVTTYDASSNEVSTRSVQQGQSGTAVMVASYTYTSATDGVNVTYFMASSSVYPAGTAVTTNYTYMFSGTVPTQKTTSFPAVPSTQNGPTMGPTLTIIEAYDAYGNVTQRTDERGIVNNYICDVVLHQVIEQVLNYQSGSGPGLNVTTDFVYDDQSRLIQTLGPSHTVVLSGTATTVRGALWEVYVQPIQPSSGAWDVDQTWTGTGYATGSGPSYTYTLIDPVSIAGMDKDGRSTDHISSDRTTGSGALSPSDTFAQTDWQSWSSTQYDDQHRTISERVYFLIPSSGTGTAGTNYGETDYGYDALERRNRVVAPGGTITRTVWTCPQWVASVWVGTNDTGATDSDPTMAAPRRTTW